MTDNSNGRSLFVTGLRNAHALEKQAREIMERQIERVESYPDLKEKLESHLAETNTQIERLDSILDSLGESSSTLKDTATSFMGNLTAMMNASMQDEILKNTFANNALENYEIAAYKSLITMAEESGNQASTGMLRQSLEEEERMAAWIDEHVRDVTLKYMHREVHGEQAGI